MSDDGIPDLLSFSERTLLREWLDEAELDELPFVDEHGGSPFWVELVWKALCERELPHASDVLAERARQRRNRERVPPLTPYEKRVAWRRFMLLASADAVTRRAIETTARLGDVGATVSYIIEAFAEFTRKVDQEAPIAAALGRLRARRARRLDGRAQRTNDASYAREARSGRPERRGGWKTK